MLLPDTFRFSDYVIDRSRWTLTWREQPVALSRKTFDVLLYLIDQRRRVVSKEELLKALWLNRVREDSNVTQQIFLLRKALSRHQAAGSIIETIPGRGYRFVPEVEFGPPPSLQVPAAAGRGLRAWIREMLGAH